MDSGISDTREATLCVIEASMGAWWLDGCQKSVLITAEQNFMQLSVLKLYPVLDTPKAKKGRCLIWETLARLHLAFLDRVPL